jgi:GntR family transcriptional regulator/MocR family aminotransferase
LAGELGVSRGVVVEAYAQLVAEGYLTSRSGGYTQVAPTATAAPPATVAPRQRPVPSRPPHPAVDFGYGRGNLQAFPRAAWLRSVRRVLTEAADERLGYLDGRGAVELRAALAAYLNRVRGTNADRETIVITNGYAQAVSLLMGLLAARGATTLAVEDPSASDDARPIAQALGMNVVGVPVGDEGVRVDAVAELDADVLILTASHQWPTGGVLSPEARAAVLAWAQRTGALVLEDDYDAEYRYDRAPVGAMQGLDPDRVAYAGTASKTLAPGFRLGWLVLPRELVEPFAEAKLLADRGSPILDQLTFADFLSRGEFDRHLRRMRPVYRSRRDALLAALADHLPELEPAGIAAGLHLVAWLPPDLEEETVIAAAAREGVAVAAVSPYRLSPAPRGGLIFGYSNLSERAIADGISRLAAAISNLREGTTTGTTPSVQRDTSAGLVGTRGR